MPSFAHSSGGRGGRAFTLVELLAVIAILGVVGGLMIVAVSRVRAAAHRGACAENMRQIALGMLTYAGENRGKLPEPIDTSATEAAGRTWDAKIRPYIDVKVGATGQTLSPTPVLRCETDPRPLIVDGTAKNWARSYALPRYPGTASWSNNLGVFGTLDGVYTSRRLAEIGTPPKALVLVELSTNTNGAITTNYQFKGAQAVTDYGGGGSAGKIDGSYYHGDVMNYAFADGHVESLPPGKITIAHFRM
ncbi:MAG TPA: prepilin-type N-terminal cleavage/methylation domain-containing protein [Rariglobus sp.]|jgi:prepilin-type processing-associated H-X9-DG protein/prepilin-type N-terminal cleavage/methylation domain-containing protein